jgi:hypothetical protein
VVERVALSGFQWWQEKLSVSKYQIKASAALSVIMIKWLIQHISPRAIPATV